MTHRPMIARLLLLCASTHAQDFGIDMSALVYEISSQQRFFDQVEESRWNVGQMDYIDGASSAVLRNPYTLAFDEDGSLFVASFTLNHVVRLRMLESKRAQYKVFVSGNMLDGPVGMVVDQGQLFVASFTNDYILRVNTSDGVLLQTFGSDAELDCPEGLAIGPDGNLYVASFLLHHVVRYELSTGRYLGQFAPPMPSQPGAARPFPPPRASDAHADESASAASAAQSFWTPSGASSGVAEGAGAQKGMARTVKGERPHPTLLGAEDLAFDWNGDLHVTAYFHNSVLKFNGSSGAFLLSYGKGVVRGPVGVTCGPVDGQMYVAAYKDSQVLRFSPEGRFLGVAAGADTQQTNALGRRQTISSPSGVRFDPHDGTLWVASYTASTVVRFNNSFGATGAHRVWKVTD